MEERNPDTDVGQVDARTHARRDGTRGFAQVIRSGLTDRLGPAEADLDAR